MRIDFKQNNKNNEWKVQQPKAKKMKTTSEGGWLEKAFNSKNNDMAKNKSKNVHR